jgi:hypothetical protein
MRRVELLKQERAKNISAEGKAARAKVLAAKRKLTKKHAKTQKANYARLVQE